MTHKFVHCFVLPWEYRYLNLMEKIFISGVRVRKRSLVAHAMRRWYLFREFPTSTLPVRFWISDLFRFKILEKSIDINKLIKWRLNFWMICFQILISLFINYKEYFLIFFFASFDAARICLLFSFLINYDILCFIVRAIKI